MAQTQLMTNLQCPVGGHGAEVPEAQAMQILPHLCGCWCSSLWGPAVLCGASHPPGFICLGFFLGRWDLASAKKQLLPSFPLEAKKDDVYNLLYNRSSWHGQQRTRTNANKAQSGEPVPEILPCSAFPQH